MESVNKIAKEMGIDPIDVKCFATSIINGMKKDGVVETFISGTEATKLDLLMAYADDACKKMDQFTTKYLTNPEARATFIKSVFAI